MMRRLWPRPRCRRAAAVRDAARWRCGACAVAEIRGRSVGGCTHGKAHGSCAADVSGIAGARAAGRSSGHRAELIWMAYPGPPRRWEWPEAMAAARDLLARVRGRGRSGPAAGLSGRGRSAEIGLSRQHAVMPRVTRTAPSTAGILRFMRWFWRGMPGRASRSVASSAC